MRPARRAPIPAEMEAVYLINVSDRREYKAISYDKETKMIELQGKLGSFKEKFDKDLFKRMGYDMVKNAA
jgi:hypothetical protein